MYIILIVLAVLFVVSFVVPTIFPIVQLLFFILFLVLLVDILMLFNTAKGVHVKRITAEKLSNGDENPIQLILENFYKFPISVRVVDEIPFQFQKRDVEFKSEIPSGEVRNIEYHLRPVERGEYHFGFTRVFALSPLKLIKRRFSIEGAKMLPVYPSYIQMRKYELMAISNRLSEFGVKKIRRIGHSMEFEQIKDYVRGDDSRTINWKATARRGDLMVNQFQDEKSQQVYSVIDKGRNMKMPFEEMALLDYAINAALVISNVAIIKGDKAGLVTFSDRMGAMLKAEKKKLQMNSIMEILYNQNTRFLETDFAKLYVNIKRKIKQRSLFLLYTNFESLASMQRQLPYLINISKSHLLVVIFFENTEVRKIIGRRTKSVEDIYIKTIAEKFNFEKRQIVKKLNQLGIQCILTAPQDLTVNTINKYLELKARGYI